MAGVNKVFLLGRLTKEPETSHTGSGMAICKFTIATSKKKKSGEEISSFHRCTTFQKTAELIGKYVGKGQQLYVEGELSYGSYDKDGVTHYTTDIIVNQFTFIGSKQQQNQQQPQQNQGGFQNQQNNQGFQGQQNQQQF